MINGFFSHQPVLLKEVASVFQNKRIRVFVDGTLGSGGHAEAILQQHEKAAYIGMDLDTDMIAEAKERLKSYSDRLQIVHGNFSDLEKVLDEKSISGIDGLLLDLGVSSRQLDIPERGFSFRYEAKLDMRLDPNHGETAFDVINREEKKKLREIISVYGEEKDASKIASAIIRFRENKPVETTTELDGIVRKAKGKHYYKKNTSAKVFQAFRIAVNRELENLEKVLPAALKALNPGGRMAVISFHSLEDRMVKRFFQEHSQTCTCPVGLPVCSCRKKPLLKVLKRGSVKAGNEEKENNPRSRSARLRFAEKTGDQAIEY